jgi:cyanuric acid amidohydrolase
MHVSAFKVGMWAPDDVAEARALLDQGAFEAGHVVAILGKTEGNGGVNDYTRALATMSFQNLLSERSGRPVSEIAKRVPIIWSGGTEGTMSPHATIFVKASDSSAKGAKAKGKGKGGKSFTVGTAYTRDMEPEEFGTMTHVRSAAEGVKRAIADAGIDDPADIHFVQIKTGALTSERIRDAQERGKNVVTKDTYGSMAYGRIVAALGIGIATGEIDPKRVTEKVLGKDMSVYSNVASTSSGLELMNCEIIVMGNARSTTSDLIMDHAVMKDAIDAKAVREALRKVGFKLDCELSDADRKDLVNVFVKCEPGLDGTIRGRRHVMFNDSDVNYTRQIRGAVNAVVASVTGDTQAYISAGAEHQGPPGGGVVAVLARKR